MKRLVAAAAVAASLFAGSIAGFQLTAGGTPGREAVAADPPAVAETIRLAIARDCPGEVGRLWEEA